MCDVNAYRRAYLVLFEVLGQLMFMPVQPYVGPQTDNNGNEAENYPACSACEHACMPQLTKERASVSFRTYTNTAYSLPLSIAAPHKVQSIQLAARNALRPPSQHQPIVSCTSGR
jgi:hypothetical protein